MSKILPIIIGIFLAWIVETFSDPVAKALPEVIKNASGIVFVIIILLVIIAALLRQAFTKAPQALRSRKSQRMAVLALIGYETFFAFSGLVSNIFVLHFHISLIEEILGSALVVALLIAVEISDFTHLFQIKSEDIKRQEGNS